MAVRYITEENGITPQFGLYHRKTDQSKVWHFINIRCAGQKFWFAKHAFTAHRRRWTNRKGERVWQVVIDNHLQTWDGDSAHVIIWPRELKDA